MMNEDHIALIWPMMARKEGHKKRLPPSTHVAKRHPLADTIQGLSRQGLNHGEIADEVGLSRSRVSQILADT